VSYAPIDDYGAIGDCRSVALVSRAGSIDWLCLPDYSSPSVFAALLDRKAGGRLAVSAAGPYRSERRYVGQSNVLETSFHTASGVARLTDAMPVLAGSAWRNELQPAREVLRIVECLAGAVDITVDFDPRPDYARAASRLERRGASAWAVQHRDELLLLRSDVPLAPDAERGVRGTARLAGGEKRYLSLSYAKSDIAVLPPLGAHAERRLAATLQWWQRWAGRCRYEGPYRGCVVRSALALKLLACGLSGAVLAAPTSSLPEERGGALNWDYRFCWLRDAAFTLNAFMALGYEAEAAAYLDWLLHATRLTRPKLHVLYDLYGESRLPESELHHLEGYCGSRPVRVGNDAWRQTQLDVYGAVIAAAHDYVSRGGTIDRAGRKLLAGFGRQVCRVWREPDHGPWEVRAQKRHYTYSKLLCWAALDRLLQLREAGAVDVPLAAFQKARDEMRRTIETAGYSAELGCYTGVLNETALDASLLRMAIVGFHPASHPRLRGTFARLSAVLGHGALFRRYDERYSEQARAEGAFAACGFWAVECLARAGDTEHARRRFEELTAYGNDLGLFAEEIDPRSAQALGNFPQAFTHAALINAALALARAAG